MQYVVSETIIVLSTPSYFQFSLYHRVGLQFIEGCFEHFYEVWSYQLSPNPANEIFLWNDTKCIEKFIFQQKLSKSGFKAKYVYQQYNNLKSIHGN